MADGAGDFFVFVCGEGDGGDEADGEPGPDQSLGLLFSGVCLYVRETKRDRGERGCTIS